MRRLPPRLFAMAAALLIGGAVHAAELTVSAAASLTQAFRELAPLFEAAHPGTAVRLNFGASGALLQQITHGAPVDVFASADTATMDQAQQQRLVSADQRVDFATNRLVVIVPRGAPAPTGLAELAQPRFARIALGQPQSVPVGRYTLAVLQQEGLWEVLSPKVIHAQHVRQALDYVARGEVDAGFVYGTDAALMRDTVHEAFTVPTRVPVRYPIAAVADSRQPALARQFVAFVGGPVARAVLARHGFGTP